MTFQRNLKELTSQMRQRFGSVTVLKVPVELDLRSAELLVRLINEATNRESYQLLLYGDNIESVFMLVNGIDRHLTIDMLRGSVGLLFVGRDRKCNVMLLANDEPLPNTLRRLDQVMSSVNDSFRMECPICNEDHTDVRVRYYACRKCSFTVCGVCTDRMCDTTVVNGVRIKYMGCPQCREIIGVA